MPDPQVSLIIPALNEAENIPLLLPRIDAAMKGRSYEVIIVDDNSRDATPAVCADLAKTYPLRLLVRTQPKNGLAGAVLHGMAEARGEILVVMDADLQHPPERLPDLLGPLDTNEADFALGSRYVPGGTTGEKWTLFRKINSRVATMLARPFAGRTNDPMSGFFALHRSTYRGAQRLTPLGYKIGLELMCKCRVQRVREVPIHFAERTRGESKLTLKEQFRYLEHLSRLYDFTFPRLSPIGKFIIVTVISWLVGAAVARGLYGVGLHPGPAVWLAYLAVLLSTAVFHRRYIRTQREFLLTSRPWDEFLLIGAAEWVVCALAAFWTTHRVNHPTALELLLIAFGSATVARYVLRKEFMQDIRGLRTEIRREELA